MTKPFWLNSQDLCAIHGEILAESGGASGILDRGSLDSTINKPKNLYFYRDRQATLYQLAATYGYGLVKNHCFVDGNKRIALIAVYTFLAINNIELVATEEDVANFFLYLATSQESQDKLVQELAEWLENNSEIIQV